MIKHEFLQYVPAYAAGSLSASEAETLERHLHEGCDICDSELRIFQEIVARLPFGLPQRKLPPDLKATIRNRLQKEQVIRTHINWPAVVQIAAAISLLTLAALFLRVQQLQVADKEQEVAELQKLLELRNREISWLRDPSVQLAMLSGLESAPQAQAKMVWSPAEYRGIFYANSMPPLPPGKSYQLWAIGSEGPLSAGVFAPDITGHAVVTISVQRKTPAVLQFAVTIEPKGGVPQPTGSMVLAGKPI